MVRFLFIGLSVLFLLYGLLEARVILHKPSIEITWPRNGSTATTSLVFIAGKGEPSSSLLLNSRKVSVSVSGEFSEPVILSKGINRFRFLLKDKFGREKELVYELVLKD